MGITPSPQLPRFNVEQEGAQTQPTSSLSRFMKPDPFPSDIVASQRYEAWLYWRQQFTVALELSGEKSQRTKANFLLMCVGPELSKLIFSMRWLPSKNDVADNSPVFDKLMKKLDNHFKDTADSTVDMGVFEAMTQGPKEGVRDFYIRLMRQAALCGLEDKPTLVKGRFIAGMKDKVTAADAYKYAWSLKKLIKTAALVESAEALKPVNWARQSSAIEVAAVEEKPTVDRVKSEFDKKKFNRFKQNKQQKPRTISQAGPSGCSNCGIIEHRVAGRCPAQGKRCMRCKRIGHFKAVCRYNAVPDDVVAKKEALDEVEEVLNMT